MAERVRVELTDFKTGRGLVAYHDLAKVSVADVARLEAAIEPHVAAIASATGMHTDNARMWLLTELIFRFDDVAAYEREAARRGVLAL